MTFITIDNKLYKVSDKDAKKIHNVPLNDADLLENTLIEIQAKYKPVQEHIKIYNY